MKRVYQYSLVSTHLINRLTRHLNLIAATHCSHHWKPSAARNDNRVCYGLRRMHLQWMPTEWAYQCCPRTM